MYEVEFSASYTCWYMELYLKNSKQVAEDDDYNIKLYADMPKAKVSEKEAYKVLKLQIIDQAKAYGIKRSDLHFWYDPFK